MTSVLEKIINLMLRGKSKELIARMQSNTDLQQAAENLHNTIVEMDKLITKAKAEQKELGIDRYL
jgi:hypothetical protein